MLYDRKGSGEYFFYMFENHRTSLIGFGIVYFRTFRFRMHGGGRPWDLLLVLAPSADGIMLGRARRKNGPSPNRLAVDGWRWRR